MQTTENLGLKKPESNDFYNVNDFNNNADALDALFKKDVNGTVAVKNATKLDGHGAEYFAKAENVLFQKVSSGADVNTFIKQGLYYFSGLATSYINAPSNTAHNGILEVYYASDHTNIRCVQRWTSCNENKTYERVTLGGDMTDVNSWKPWQTIATTADLAKYLPLTGGTVNGNLVLGNSERTASTSIDLMNALRHVYLQVTTGGEIRLRNESGNIFNSTADGTNTFNGVASGNLPLTGGKIVGSVSLQGTTEEATFLQMGNPNRTLQQIVYPNGNLVFYDYTNNQTVFDSTVDGRNSFNGTASGNLPLDGGTLKRTARRILTLDNIHESASGSAIGFSANGTFLGEVGVTTSGNLVFNNTVVEYALLHTGNSAKVHIGTSAPSDTSSLWIDTSA